MAQLGPGCFNGGTGGCGPGDPRISQGLPGAFSSLTLAPRGPSDGRGLLSSCQDACSLMGIFRRGPRACILEPSQAAAQRADITEAYQPSIRASRLPPSALHHQGWLFHPMAGPQVGPPSPRLDHLSSLVLHPASTRPPLPPPLCSPAESFKLQTQSPSPLLKTLHGSLVPRHKAQAPNLACTHYMGFQYQLFFLSVSSTIQLAPAPRVP